MVTKYKNIFEKIDIYCNINDYFLCNLTPLKIIFLPIFPFYNSENHLELAETYSENT